MQLTTKEDLSHQETERSDRIDVSKMLQPDLLEQFAKAFERELDISHSGDSATEKWDTLRDTMHRTALTIFGKKTSDIHDWFEAKLTEMTPVIEAKRAALAEYKRSFSEKYLQIPRAKFSRLPGQ